LRWQLRHFGLFSYKDFLSETTFDTLPGKVVGFCTYVDLFSSSKTTYFFRDFFLRHLLYSKKACRTKALYLTKLLSRYKHGQMNMAWHVCDEKNLGPLPWISILFFSLIFLHRQCCSSFGLEHPSTLWDCEI
jgi:hypothetical protein